MVHVSWPIPIIEKARWIYRSPSSSSTHPINNVNENQLKEFNESLQLNQTHIANLNTFSQIYAERHNNLKFEYKQKIAILEKGTGDNDLNGFGAMWRPVS